MDHNKIFEFTAAVRGFHYYKAFWNPVTNQKLSCAHEENDPFDMFAIKVCEGTKIVGHLPMQISRASKFLMDRGAKFMVELVSTNCRCSPLVQGGLEIPAKITVTLPGTVSNHLLIDKYKEIVTENYAEPKKEEILGSFLALPPEPIRKLKEQKSTPKVTTKKEKRKTKGQDMRKLFRKIAEKNEKEDDEIDLRIEKKTTKADCIEID